MECDVQLDFMGYDVPIDQDEIVIDCNVNRYNDDVCLNYYFLACARVI